VARSATWEATSAASAISEAAISEVAISNTA
jgi:hypothetical protein